MLEQLSNSPACCRSLVLKACPSYAQTEVQLDKQSDGGLVVQHHKLAQPAHRGLCLAFALQAMSQKLMMNKQGASLTRPVSVHDAGAIEVRGDVAVAVIGELLAAYSSLICHFLGL